MSDAISAAIRQAMTKREMSARDVATAMDIPVSTVYSWLSAHHRPLVRSASVLADLLDWPSLATMVRDAWTTPCPVCGRLRVHGSAVGKYCGRRCQNTAHSREKRARVVQTGVLAQRRLKIHERAIDQLCRRWCEPETGVCRDATCPIQREGLSPLPLSERRRVA